MYRRCHKPVPDSHRRWERQSTRPPIKHGRAPRRSPPALLTAARRELPGLVLGSGPVAMGQGHCAWSARYRRLTPPRCLPALRRGGFLRQGDGISDVPFDYGVVGAPQARSLQHPDRSGADQGEPALRPSDGSMLNRRRVRGLTVGPRTSVRGSRRTRRHRRH